MLQIEATDKSHVTLTGRFDASQVSTAEVVLNDVEGHCILDCQRLDYISSAGIGVILATYKRLHDQGGSLRMINANDHIRQVFRYAGLDKFIDLPVA